MKLSYLELEREGERLSAMGCVNSKTKEDPNNTGKKYANPATTPTTATTSVPAPHQQVSQQISQHRISVISGDVGGSRNGSVGYGPQPTVPPPLPEDDGSLFIARYAYQARTSEDLSFEKGEKLKVRELRVVP